jgi:integrase
MSLDGHSQWETSRHQNLIRYRPSGTYFARFKSGGKLIRKSLKTSVFSVAKLRLPDTIKEHRGVAESRRRFGNGKLTVGDAVQIYKDKIDIDPELKPKSKDYYNLVLDFILKSWSGLESLDVRGISEGDCKKWSTRFRRRYAPSVVNGAIGVLRAVFNEAVETGARFGNPAAGLKRAKLRPKKLKLPSREEFRQFVDAIANGGSRDSKNCADLVRFLAFSGLRISEAANVAWRDVDFATGRLRVHGDPDTGTKNSEMRVVPIIPELKELLQELRTKRIQEAENSPVMRVREAQKSMDRAAKIVGMERITHHDLRHLFATICIESGVDVPTVSRWLGHKDGGALCMKTYGHLRDEHSAAQAQRVKFASDVAQPGRPVAKVDDRVDRRLKYAPRVLDL